MTATIHDFTGTTRLDLDPDRVLEASKDKLKGVLILGFDKDGEFYAAGSYADGADVLWLLELCKHCLMHQA